MTPVIESIWFRFHKELRAFILNKTRNAADTDDILQDVFVKIIQNFDKVNQSKNLQKYLYGIVRNAVSDHFRTKKPVMDTSGQEEKFTEPEYINLNTTVAECCIRPFINKLPEHYREALLLTEFQNISQKELAEKLNISYSGAKSRVQRGREKMKEFFKQCCAYQKDVYGNITGLQSRSLGCGCDN